MFETLKNKEANQDKQCVEFIQCYIRFLEDLSKIYNTPQDKERMRRFAFKIDTMWQHIPEEKRDILVHALLAKKLLPEELKNILQVFNGKVISLT